MTCFHHYFLLSTWYLSYLYKDPLSLLGWSHPSLLVHFSQNTTSRIINLWLHAIFSVKKSIVLKINYPNFSFITIKIMSSVFYIIANLKNMLISFRLSQCWNTGQYFWWHYCFLALEIYHTCFFSTTSGMGTFWSKLLRFLVAVDCDL